MSAFFQLKPLYLQNKAATQNYYYKICEVKEINLRTAKIRSREKELIGDEVMFDNNRDASDTNIFV